MYIIWFLKNYVFILYIQNNNYKNSGHLYSAQVNLSVLMANDLWKKRECACNLVMRLYDAILATLNRYENLEIRETR